MYSVPIAYLLWFISGFGALGLHRFYLGKMGSGLIWLLTGGFFVFGSVYDFFTLPSQVREANIREHYRRTLDYTNQLDPKRYSDRVEKRDSLERIILRTAKKNAGIVTPSEVALEGNISLDSAKKNLDKLAEGGYAELRVTKAGVIVYVFPDFTSSHTTGGFENF